MDENRYENKVFKDIEQFVCGLYSVYSDTEGYFNNNQLDISRYIKATFSVHCMTFLNVSY